jgi:hypothetical protein
MNKMIENNTMNILKSTYQDLTGKAKTRFRIEVMESCGWNSEPTFRRKLDGDLKKIEIDVIRKIIRRYELV